MWWDDAEMGYIARQSQLDKIVDLMAKTGKDCNDPVLQQQIFNQVGIDSDTFNNAEIEYMEKEIEKRLMEEI